MQKVNKIYFTKFTKSKMRICHVHNQNGLRYTLRVALQPSSFLEGEGWAGQRGGSNLGELYKEGFSDWILFGGQFISPLAVRRLQGKSFNFNFIIGSSQFICTLLRIAQQLIISGKPREKGRGRRWGRKNRIKADVISRGEFFPIPRAEVDTTTSFTSKRVKMITEIDNQVLSNFW